MLYYKHCSTCSNKHNVSELNYLPGHIFVFYRTKIPAGSINKVLPADICPHKLADIFNCHHLTHILYTVNYCTSHGEEVFALAGN